MQTLLLAMRSGGTANSLKTALSPHFDVHICHTASDATELLDRLRPEILLLDLRLDSGIGPDILSICKQKPAVTLAVTDFVSKAVLDLAAHSGISGLMILPCSIEFITQQLLKMAEKIPSPG